MAIDLQSTDREVAEGGLLVTRRMEGKAILAINAGSSSLRVVLFALRNDLDRFHLVEDVIDRVPKLGAGAAYIKQLMRDKLIEHKNYIILHGEDMEEIRDWKWPY